MGALFNYPRQVYSLYAQKIQIAFEAVETFMLAD